MLAAAYAAAEDGLRRDDVREEPRIFEPPIACIEVLPTPS
jgi:hypothetical protein